MWKASQFGDVELVLHSPCMKFEPFPEERLLEVVLLIPPCSILRSLPSVREIARKLGFELAITIASGGICWCHRTYPFDFGGLIVVMPCSNLPLS